MLKTGLARPLTSLTAAAVLVFISGCAAKLIKPVIPERLMALQGSSVLPETNEELKTGAEHMCIPASSAKEKAFGFEMAVKLVENTNVMAVAYRNAALLLSQCAVMYADWTKDKTLKKEIVQVGMDAADIAGASLYDPTASYYYALNLGVIINDTGLDAFKKISDLTKHLKRAAASVPQLDDGGPVRVLGMVYLKAPPWPLGPGDTEKALELLRNVVKKYPMNPLNHLFLAEALIKDGDGKEADEELDIAENLASNGKWGDYRDRWLNESEALRKKIK